MPRRLKRINKLKRPVNKPSTVEKQEGSKKTKVPIVPDELASEEEIPSSPEPGPSYSEAQLDDTHTESEQSEGRRRVRGRRRGIKKANDNDGTLTDRLMETIKTGNQYPKRAPLPKTLEKKVQFSSTLKSIGSKKNRRLSSDDEDELDLEQTECKQSLEILQGLSKIKIDDWYPFYDFQEKKQQQNERDDMIPSEQGNEKEKESEVDDDDEWEETLVYLDLEDIPDADNLFSSLESKDTITNHEDEDENGENTEGVEVKVFNMDSELPVLLLGGKYLAGRWEDTLGTSLFFQKRNENESTSSPNPNDPPSGNSSGKLKSLVSDPEIPFDPLFGENFGVGSDRYDLVSKSLKTLKVKYFPVVNEDLKGEDVIRDADNEFDQKDFQIPPASLVRQFYGDDVNYEKYMSQDIERRRKIREKWSKPEDNLTFPYIKPEPIDPDEFADDEFDMELDLDDNFTSPSITLSLEGSRNVETPGTSRSIKKK